MIIKTYKVNISLDEEITTEGVSRFPVVWTIEKNNNCLDITPASGVLNKDGQIEFTVSADDELCLTNSSVTLNLVDNIGCPKSQGINLINPCNLTISEISTPSKLNFLVTASNGTPPYTYAWNYDTSLFTANSLNSPVLSLNPIQGQTVDRAEVSVQVIDANGCERTATYNQQLCPFIIESKTINTYCVSVIKDISIKAKNSNVTLPITTECDINWDTFSYTSSNTGVTMINNGNGNFEINVADGTSAGTITIQYTVENQYGVVSPVGTLFIQVPSCSDVATGADVIAGETLEVPLTTSNTIGSTVEFNVEDNVYSTSPIKWDSFLITQAPQFGTAALNSSRKLVYTISNLTGTNTDQVGWEIENEVGQKLKKRYYINRNIIAAPVANNINVCAACNEATSITDITTNDTGDIDKSSIIITQGSPFIDISRNADNDFIFTPTKDATFTNIVRYKVANSQGTFSNEANVIISSVCAGTPSNLDITCSSQTFDLADLFPNTNAFTRSFSEVGGSYTGQGGAIIGANGTVDFTGISSGTYTFRQTATSPATCAATTQEADIVIVKQDVPSLNITSASITSTDIGTVEFTAINIPLGSITILNNGGRPVYTTTPTLVGSNGTFNLQLVSGANVITMQATTICGSTITQTSTINN